MAYLIISVQAILLYIYSWSFNHVNPWAAYLLLAINVVVLIKHSKTIVKHMKKIFSVLVCTVFISSCTLVPPNNAGVLMENYGKAGKSDFSLQKGRVFTMAPGTELFVVPLWEQRGNYGDNYLHLKAADNTEFTAKPVYSFRVIESRAIDVVFENKQLGSGEEFMKSLEDNILENKIYDIMKEESRKYTTDSLMANGGSLRFEQDVQDKVQKEFDAKGLALLTFSCQLDFSAKVKAKIDTRNEVNTNISVLDQKIAEQRKQNELAELMAQERLIESKGITPQLLQMEFIRKWDGHTPIYGSAPFFIKNTDK